MDYHNVVIFPGPGIGVAPSRGRGRRRSSRGVSVILTIPGIGSSRSCHNTNGGPSRGDGRRTGRASLLFLAAISDALSSRSGCSSPAYLDVVMLSCKTRPHLDRCVMDSAHSLHFTVQMPSPLSSLSLSLSPSGLHFAHVSLGVHLCFCGHGACFRAPPSAKGRHHFKSLSKYPTLSAKSAFEVNSYEWLTHESCRNDIKIMSTVGYSQVGFISLVHACMIIIHACVRCGPIEARDALVFFVCSHTLIHHRS